MLNSDTKRHIDAARDVLVGVAPNPMTQIDQITYALIYKFMDDMDEAAVKAGGERSFFTGDLAPYAWSNLVDTRIGSQEKMDLFAEALTRFAEAPQLPELFRTIFRAAFLPYRSPETLGLFIKEINYFDYSHPEELGNAYEYLLSIMSSQGDAGQFRTPRHIIDFMVDVLDPTKDDTILDPACGTGGFLVSSYNHILEKHDGKDDPKGTEKPLTPAERKKLTQNLAGYDIDPSMVRIAQVNMYLHQFKNPQIFQYDGLTSEERWNDKFDVILANPPFMSPKGGIKPHNKFGIQSNRAEVLFVDYIASHLKPTGRAAIVVPEGIIFQTDKSYKELRKSLIEGGLYAVVSLPAGVFQPYSGVKTSILFIDNDVAKQKSQIAFIKISADGFEVGAKKRAVLQNDLPAALGILQDWVRDEKSEHPIASFVDKEKIGGNGDYNLAGDRYQAGSDNSNAKWPMVKIGDVFKIESGGTPSTTNPTFWDGDIPWVTLVDVDKSVSVIGSTVRKITPAGLAGSSAKLLPKNTVIVSSRATIGRIAILGVPMATNQGFKNVIVDDANSASYVAYALSNKVPDMISMASGATFKEISKTNFASIQIPLPPLEVQQKIVTELDEYASIVSGAKQIVNNWKPQIEVDPSWEIKELGEVLALDYGKPLKQEDRVSGPFPVFGSNGQVGSHNEFLVEGPMIVVGRKGSAGAVTWSDANGFPIDTTFYVSLVNPSAYNLKFVYFMLKGMNLDKVNVQSGVPGLNRNDAYKLPFPAPVIELQNEIVDQFASEEAMVKSASDLVKIYEAKIEAAIAKLWSE